MKPQERKERVLNYVTNCGPDGATWYEVGDSLKIHHGQSSSALSDLHRTGSLARLRKKRKKCSVYVAPVYVNDRETEPYGRAKSVRRVDVDKMIDTEINEALVQIYGLMNVIKPKYPQTHFAGCWQIHPYCALAAAARRVSERKSAISRR